MRTEDMKAVTHYVKFYIGDTVYLRLNREEYRGMVTGYNIRPNGVTYLVSWEDASDTCHYDLELTTEFIPDYNSPNSDD